MFVAILIREAYRERHIICMVTNSKHNLKKRERLHGKYMHYMV